MASKISINLDTSKENFLVNKCKQNDDLTLEAYIYENGAELNLTNKDIIIQALKADNTYIIQNTEIVKENNKISAELDRDFSRVPGATKIEIVLVESGKQNTTFSFYLEVSASVIKGAVESSNTVTILEALDNKIIEAIQVKEDTEQLIESGGAATTGDIANINAQLEDNTKQNEYLQGLLSGCKTVFCGIDSLTAGAGGNSYLDFFRPLLMGQLGDGSLGLNMMESSIAVAENIGFQKTTGLNYMSNQDYSLEPTKYSINGMGLYCNNGSDEAVTWDTKEKYFEKARIYYLQQPNGGTFKYGLAGINSSLFKTVDTNGVLDLKYVELESSKEGGLITKCNYINGKVAIFGVYLYNSTGVTVSRLAKGGDKLESHMKLDGTFRTKWITSLMPDLYIMNCGMNDRTAMTKEVYKTNIQNWINQVKSGNPNISILLVHSNQSADYSTTNLKDYKDVLIELSESNKVGFINISDYLGNYETASNKGYMADTIHPNSEGNKIIASAIMKKLGYAMNGKNITISKPVWGNGVAEKQYKTALTTKDLTINSGVNQVIYKIGLINGTPLGVLKLRVFGQRNGTRAMCEKEYFQTIGNTTVVNKVTNADTIQKTDKFEIHFDSTVTDFTLTSIIVDGFLQVAITPNTGTNNMNFHVEGEIILPTLTVSGKSVYEN